MQSGRYILDPLYGRITFSERVWRAALTPEMQRLREVRMCNINSLSLTGGANINRYEHSLGTAHLAEMCLATWPTLLSRAVRETFQLAALLHDTMTAPFGHSVEYVLEDSGFDHAALEVAAGQTKQEGFRYWGATLQPLYFGFTMELPSMLESEELREISALIRGEGDLGPLIAGSMDLDNIDNVFRLAYHYGIAQPGKAPLELARALWTENGQLCIRDDALRHAKEWVGTREQLYRYLLLNPDEFSAKCMLEEALLASECEGRSGLLWNDVDFQILARLAQASSPASEVIRRLMVGDLYGCLGIYAVDPNEISMTLSDPEARAGLESALTQELRAAPSSALRKAMVKVHIIKDFNKTSRRVELVTASGRRAALGTPSCRYLVGVFLKNKQFSASRISDAFVAKLALGERALRAISEYLNTKSTAALPLYGEGRNQ